MMLLAAHASGVSSYGFIIGASLTIIISYFFNLFARKTNIPSVLMLIGLGVVVAQTLFLLDYPEPNLFPALEVLGIVGLIMIVLEAALDLDLKKEKKDLIVKSFFTALVSLLLNLVVVAAIIYSFVCQDVAKSVVYAIPLSIMSSAIVIPSLGSLNAHKKEFMVYESTFSDILGIMLFFFTLKGMKAESAAEVVSTVGLNILLTVVIAVAASYLLIVLFQRIRTNVKLFLLISVLVLLYSIGKMAHLSSLLIILTFGLFLQNDHIFFRGEMRRFIDTSSFYPIYRNFKLITIESSFVIRTFFFVIFGMTVELRSLLNLEVALISLLLLVALYALRFVALKLFVGKGFLPELYVAPRGLITILLFFSIPHEYEIVGFNEGILLFTIIISCVIMAIALVRFKKS